MVDNSLLIIVPTLNSHKVLVRLVKSLISQTFKNWRVIFIDGKSSLKDINYLKKLCKKDKRFLWFTQKENYQGIYGAMNQGINYVKKNEWTLFWGSDDWAFDENSFKNIMYQIERFDKNNPFFIIAKGIYVDLNSFKLKRRSKFVNPKDKCLSSRKFNSLMFLGNTPPHQTTIFSPNALKEKMLFEEKFKIAADLNYFLRVGKYKNIKVCLINHEIVKIGMGGFSSQSNIARLKEVYKCYEDSFGVFAFIPFVLRYINRVKSLI